MRKVMTYDGRTMDGRQLMTKAHMAFDDLV